MKNYPGPRVMVALNPAIRADQPAPAPVRKANTKNHVDYPTNEPPQ